MKFFKTAMARRWAIALGTGELKREIPKLSKILPKGTVGSTSKKALGGGYQGSVYPSHTVGKGKSVAKIYHEPNLYTNKLTSLYLREATKKGTPGLVKVYKTLGKGKGHIAERLKPRHDVGLGKSKREIRLWKRIDKNKFTVEFGGLKSGPNQPIIDHRPTRLLSKRNKTKGLRLSDTSYDNIMRNSKNELVIADPIISPVGKSLKATIKDMNRSTGRNQYGNMTQKRWNILRKKGLV